MDSAPFSKVARRKLDPLAEGFRFYCAEWLGEKPEDWHAMRVTGACFRPAKSGPRKGQLVVPLPGTKRSAIVTREEIAAEKT